MHDLADFFDVELSGFGQFQWLFIPVKKRHADFIFYLLDGDTERGLRHEKSFGGLGKAAFLIDRVDVFHFLLHENLLYKFNLY